MAVLLYLQHVLPYGPGSGLQRPHGKKDRDSIPYTQEAPVQVSASCHEAHDDHKGEDKRLSDITGFARLCTREQVWDETESKS